MDYENIVENSNTIEIYTKEPKSIIQINDKLLNISSDENILKMQIISTKYIDVDFEENLLLNKSKLVIVIGDIL